MCENIPEGEETTDEKVKKRCLMSAMKDSMNVVKQYCFDEFTLIFLVWACII